MVHRNKLLIVKIKVTFSGLTSKQVISYTSVNVIKKANQVMSCTGISSEVSKNFMQILRFLDDLFSATTYLVRPST